MAERKLQSINLDRAGTMLMGGLTGGPAGAFAAASGDNQMSFDQSGQDFNQPPTSQSYYQEMAPGDVPMMSDDQASLFASFANQPQTSYQQQYVDTSSDFGVLSASTMPSTNYTGYDPSISMGQYPPVQTGYDSSTIQSPFGIAQPQGQGFIDSNNSLQQAPVVVNNNIGPAPAQIDGSSSQGSGSTMNATQIAGTATGGAAVLGLSGIGGAAFLRKRRQQPHQLQEMYDDGSMIGNGMLSGLPRAHRSKDSTDYGDIYTERDKFGNEVPQIKTASALRRMTWSAEKQDEYQILLLSSKLELARNERQGYGIESLKSIEDDRAQVERLRQQLAHQRMQKQYPATTAHRQQQPFRQVTYQRQTQARPSYQGQPRPISRPQQQSYQTRQSQGPRTFSRQPTVRVR